MVTTLIVAAICGIAVGILSGLFGIGGGIVVIPLMRLGFGAEALVTTGTSLFVILPTSLASAIGRARKAKLNVKLGLCVGIGGMCLSPVGSWLASYLGGTASMLAAAIVIAYTGISMIRKALKLPSADSAATSAVTAAAPGNTVAAGGIGNEDQMFTDVLAFEMNGKHIAQALGVGAIAGFLSGFIGVGGGFLIVPMLMWLFGFSFKDATGISTMALCLIAIPGVITHGILGHIDYLRGIAIAAGSIPGTFIGTALLSRIREKPLRIAFGILIFCMAGILAINELV